MSNYRYSYVLTLLSCIYATVVRGSNLYSYVIQDIPEKGMKIGGASIGDFSGIQDFSSCGIKCLNDDNCKSFNYGGGQCQLMGTALCQGIQQLVSGNGLDYYDVERSHLDEVTLYKEICEDFSLLK